MSDNIHEWDATGERCVKCGAKDWMGGECSSSAPPACYKATEDKSKMSGCEHEDGSGWCTAGDGVSCEDANICHDWSIGCNRAL